MKKVCFCGVELESTDKRETQSHTCPESVVLLKQLGVQSYFSYNEDGSAIKNIDNELLFKMRNIHEFIDMGFLIIKNISIGTAFCFYIRMQEGKVATIFNLTKKKIEES